jgi:sarcosine oxidase, subunit gamma
VSVLDFLTPEASGPVAARSPMEHLARSAGARFELRDGWNVAVAFGDGQLERRRMEETVAFADRSHLAKFELQAQPRVLAAAVTAITAETTVSGGTELEPGTAVRAADAWWCAVTPSRALVLAEPTVGHELRRALTAALGEAAGGTTTTLVDLTCGLAAMALIGPGARELLARFCAVDVRPAVTPVRGFRPGSVARTPGYVLVEAEQRLLILVGWALGEYLYEVVSDAAIHLGGGPVGADALGVHQLA